MKSVSKITRIQLETNHLENVVIYGIVSSEPDYKLSLLLNKNLRISLKNISPVIIYSDNGNQLSFSRFSCLAGSTDETFTLLSNRTGKNFLMKNLRNIDYIFCVQEPDVDNNADRITSIFKKTQEITSFFLLDTKSIKDKYFQYLIP